MYLSSAAIGMAVSLSLVAIPAAVATIGLYLFTKDRPKNKVN